jgi:CRISPR/Cas system CMR subunit Cmr4 (Cas7 group RAMP superfamily)
MKFLKHILSVLLLIVTLNASAQDFHTSNIKVDYEQDTGTLNITCRLFTAHLEKAVGENVGNKSAFENKLKAYVDKNLDVKINGKNVNATDFIYSVNDKSTRIFYKVGKVSDINSLEMKVGLLTDVFNDQQNIVNVDIKNNRKNANLSSGNEVFKMSF